MRCCFNYQLVLVFFFVRPSSFESVYRQSHALSSSTRCHCAESCICASYLRAQHQFCSWIITDETKQRYLIMALSFKLVPQRRREKKKKYVGCKKKITTSHHQSFEIIYVICTKIAPNNNEKQKKHQHKENWSKLNDFVVCIGLAQLIHSLCQPI